MARLVDQVLRAGLLRAGASPGLQKVVTKALITKQVVQRFIAGDTLDAAWPAVESLVSSGLRVSVDILGEHTSDRAQAEEAASRYEALLAQIGQAGLGGAVEASLKLSAVGQALPEGHAIALDQARRICSAASAVGTTITLDMEDHTTTDSTLDILGELRADFPGTGAVIQAALRRSASDCRGLATPHSRVRLCKGAYAEPASVAFTDKTEVDASYQECLAILMRGQGYPMVASHDPAMISAASQLAVETGRGAADFEYQMLYGIRPIEQQRLANDGQTVRIYLPYGSDWYAYFIRRLAERPANVAFFLRAIAGRR